MRKLKLLAGSAVLLAASAASTAHADQQILDDLIVVGSLCVGQDCVNGESFGFDTIRLKENNLRIRFFDTSSSGSFPTNDWQITANDSSNGGDSYLAFEDIDGGRIPFRVDASSPTNSLRVRNNGNIGLGTGTPVVELHVVDGDSPTLRLEQDGSSGFTPQTYDLAANEANFFIRDVTNGSRLFFRAKPGAPEDSIHIQANGAVIMGDDTNLDGDRLTIRHSGADRFIGVSLWDGDDADNWRMLHDTENDQFFISAADSGCAEMRLGVAGGAQICGDMRVGQGGATGNLEVRDNLTVGYDGTGNVVVNGTLTTATGNTCAAGCDRVFDPDYDLPTIEEHAEYMFANRHLQHVGPTDEDGHINVTGHIAGMLNHLETAHIYIAQLNDRITELEARLEESEEG